MEGKIWLSLIGRIWITLQGLKVKTLHANYAKSNLSRFVFSQYFIFDFILLGVSLYYDIVWNIVRNIDIVCFWIRKNQSPTGKLTVRFLPNQFELYFEFTQLIHLMEGKRVVEYKKIKNQNPRETIRHVTMN